MQQQSPANGNGESRKRCACRIIVSVVFLFCITAYTIWIGRRRKWIYEPPPPVSPQHPTQDGNNTSKEDAWTPSPKIVDNNGGDIYFFFHLHQAGGTLVCDIANGLQLSTLTSPSRAYCNLDTVNNALYEDMPQLIDYLVSKGINFIANEEYMPTLGTFVKYMYNLNDDHDDSDQDTNDINITRIPRIHLATILRHPIDLLLSEYMHVQEVKILVASDRKEHYSAADMFNETDFMHYIENKDYDNGNLLYRYSGWCRDKNHKIVDNENKYKLCSSFANEWFDQFDIICFIDEMDLCIENLIKNYFCKYDKDGIIDECQVDDGDKYINNLIKYYQMKMVGTKQRIEWQKCLKNQMNIRSLHEKLKYEILFYNETKTRYGKGKFFQAQNLHANQKY